MASDRVTELVTMLRRPVLERDFDGVNRIATVAALRYSLDEYAEAFLSIVAEARDIGLEHYWLNEACPCGGDPTYHERDVH